SSHSPHAFFTAISVPEIRHQRARLSSIFLLPTGLVPDGGHRYIPRRSPATRHGAEETMHNHKLFWCGAAVVLALAAGICGFGIFRATRPAPVASIPEQVPEVRLVPPLGVNEVSDDQARARVLQLIDLNVLSQAPVIKNPFSVDGEECAEPPLAGAIKADYSTRIAPEYPALVPAGHDDAPAIMLYADDDAPAVMPYAEEQVVENTARVDLCV